MILQQMYSGKGISHLIRIARVL